MTVRERLKTDLLKAIKARHSGAVTALRTTLAAIDNAEAVEVTPELRATFGQATEVQRKVLTETDIRAIVQREIDDLRAHCAKYEQLGNTAKVDQLQVQLAALIDYL